MTNPADWVGCLMVMTILFAGTNPSDSLRATEKPLHLLRLDCETISAVEAGPIVFDVKITNGAAVPVTISIATSGALRMTYPDSWRVRPIDFQSLGIRPISGGQKDVPVLESLTVEPNGSIALPFQSPHMAYLVGRGEHRVNVTCDFNLHSGREKQQLKLEAGHVLTVLPYRPESIGKVRESLLTRCQQAQSERDWMLLASCVEGTQTKELEPVAVRVALRSDSNRATMLDWLVGRKDEEGSVHAVSELLRSADCKVCISIIDYWFGRFGSRPHAATLDTFIHLGNDWSRVALAAAMGDQMSERQRSVALLSASRLAPPVTAERWRTIAELLNSPRFMSREEGMKQCRQLGRTVLPFLKTVKSGGVSGDFADRVDRLIMEFEQLPPDPNQKAFFEWVTSWRRKGREAEFEAILDALARNSETEYITNAAKALMKKK